MSAKSDSIDADVPDIGVYVRSLSADTLADLILTMAARNKSIRDELATRAKQRGEVAAARELLSNDTSTTATSDDQQSRITATKIRSVLDTLQRLLDAGTQANVTVLARQTVDKVRDSLGSDSDSALVAEFPRAVMLYARACTQNPPPAENLAQWVVDANLREKPPTITKLADFAEPLGAVGIARVKTLAAALLNDHPADQHARQVAMRLLEEVAEVSGDVDEFIRVLSKKLPDVDISRQIVRVLRSAGRHSEAITHVAQALTPRRVERDPAEGKPSDRSARPKRETSDGGVSGGKPSVDQVRDKNSGTKKNPIETRAHKLIENGSLDKAVLLYQKTINDLVSQRDAQSYQEAATLLRGLRTVCRREKISDQFSTYLAELVATNRRKTRFITELRNARIAVPRP